MTATTAPVRGSILFAGEAGPRDPNSSLSRARRYSASDRLRGFPAARRFVRGLLVLKRFVGAGICLGLFQFQHTKLSAWSRTLCRGPNAISGMKQANSPNGPWLFKT